MAKIPTILEAGRADGKLIKTDSVYDDNQEKFLSDKIKEIDDNHTDLTDTVNSLTNTVNNNESDIEAKLVQEKLRASNAENNLRETINNITEVNTNATSANIVTIDTIPNTSSSNVQQALNELFKNALFAGIATPTTNPGTPDGPVFYIATEAGTYSNFNGISVANGETVILQWNNGSWVKKVAGLAIKAEIDKKFSELESSNKKYTENVAKALQQIAEKTNSTIITKEDGFFLVDANNKIGFGYDVVKGFICYKVEESTLNFLKSIISTVVSYDDLDGNLKNIIDSISDNNSYINVSNFDGLLLLDSLNNVGMQIGSLLYWTNAPYNKKYGWGGHPYGNGTLPPFSRVAGILEADMLSVRGGKGRWNGEDTGNFKHGGHVFEGWNKEEDVRLTAGIGLKNKDVGWLQTFHPATEEGTDSGAYYGITQIGSDIEGNGVAFMPNVWHMKKPYNEMDLNWGPYMNSDRKNNIEKMIECEIMSSSDYNSDKKGYKGLFYYDYGDKAIKLFDGTKWHTFKETLDAEFTVKLVKTSVTGYQIDKNTAIAHKPYSCIITAKEGYELPETLVGVKSLYLDVPYTYNKETGALSIEGQYVEGYVEISVV